MADSSIDPDGRMNGGSGGGCAYIADALRSLAVPIDSVRLDPANVRTHGQKNLDAIAASLARWGQRSPIIVQREGMVVRAGNGRVLAAKSLGWKHIAALIVDESSVEATAFAIADNRTAELAEWDTEGLAALLQSMEGQDRIDAGFDDVDLDALLRELGPNEVVEDEVPEPPVDPITKPGDLWLLGEHRLLCGDSTKRESVERLMDGRRAVLSFTSPPYANQRTYTKEGDLSTEYLARFIPAATPFVDVFAVNLGLARHGGRLVRYWDDYILAAESAGLGLLSWNVWDRGAPKSIGQQTAMFPIEHEWVLVFANKPVDLVPTIKNKTAGEKTSARVRGADGKLGKDVSYTKRHCRELGTIWRGVPVTKNDIHPAMFPVGLAAAYIASFDGDTYEPFSGSGTTIIAAEQLGRRCYAIEISPQYCDVAVARWEKLTGKKAVLA